MTYQSGLAKDIKGFLELKESLGYCKSSYESYLASIDVFCSQKYPAITIMTKDFVMDWAQKRSNESVNSQKRRNCVIRELGKYQKAIGREAYVLPSEYIGNYLKYFPYLFSDEELSILFSTFDETGPHFESPGREYIIPVLFRMMYCCGLRPGESLMLTCTDVDIASGALMIRESKAHRDRVVVMSEELRILCQKYDSLMGPREFFFQHFDGGPCPVHWMRNQFKICWRKSGLDNGQKSPRPYDLRHNFATRVLLRWMDEGTDVITMIPYLSEYMGHGDFSTTMYYIHLIPENLIKNAGIDWERFTRIFPEISYEED